MLRKTIAVVLIILGIVLVLAGAAKVLLPTITSSSQRADILKDTAAKKTKHTCSKAAKQQALAGDLRATSISTNGPCQGKCVPSGSLQCKKGNGSCMTAPPASGSCKDGKYCTKGCPKGWKKC